MITFAVVGHNEEATLAEALRQAMEAAGQDDRVCFVDSASTDGSVAIAVEHGVEVVSAPLGKGAAIKHVLARAGPGHVCLVDGDIESSERNFPLALAEAIREGGADMVVGAIDWREKRFQSVTAGIYNPLVRALFPEAADRYGPFPLSGFRALRPELVPGALPGGFGAEAYLNVLAAIRGAKTQVVPLGRYAGPLRDKRGMGREVAAGLLDLAHAEGRLPAGERGPWEEWVEQVTEVIVNQPKPEEPEGDYRARLEAAAERHPHVDDPVGRVASGVTVPRRFGR